MNQCARVGCAHPQTTPDTLGLGLCDHHNHQFKTGTLAPVPTAAHTTIEACKILDEISNPGTSLRELSRITGIPKSTIHVIKRQTWHHVMHSVWEKLADAKATHLAERTSQ